jgi:hypothetical protein
MMRFRHLALRRPSGRTVAVPIAALLVLATFACSLDKLTVPTEGPDPLDAAISGDSLVGLAGATTLVITTAGGSLPAGPVVVWSSSNPAVATVDETTGLVTGLTLGNATINAKIIAPELGEINAASLAVRVRYAGIKITTVDSLIAIGMTKVIQVRGVDAKGALQPAIAFSSAMQVVSRDANIFDVNVAGALVAKTNGTARLFVQYDGLKDSLNVKVRQVARSITFPAAVGGELPIQSINKDRTLALTVRDSLGVTITAPSAAAWTTSDATTVTVGATTGVARGLKLGIARVRATVDGKIDSISARVTQVAGVINKVAGDAQSATVGAAVTTLPLVAVLDSGNTPIPNAAVTFSVASGGGAVTGATPTASVTGQASVGSWTLGTTAGANTLTASSGGASATFTATGTPGAATKLIFTTQPSNSASGAALATFRVAVADANDNVVTTTPASITVSLASGPGTIGGTQTVATTNGVAVFSAVTLSGTGAYTITATANALTPVTSNSFAVFGPATKLGFTTQPVGNTATITMQTFRVAVQDAAGNTVTSGASATATVTLTLNTGSFTAGSTVSVAAVAGVATFSNVAAAAAGTFTIGATATALTAATSSSFTVAAVGPAAKLAFTVQPANGTAGSALADIKVTVQDVNGVANTSSTAAVTLGIETNVGGASISAGVTTVNAIAGVATFTGIALNKSGNGYRLNATSGSLTKGVSNTFNLTAGAAFKLGFAAAIPNAVTATAISPAVQVQVQDANGNVVTTATNSITITSSTGTLSGGAATAATAGVATFSALSLAAAGSYTLIATATGLQTGTSTSFNVVSSTAAIKLAFITQPSNAVAGSAVAPPIQVAIQDFNGNTVSSTASVALTIASGPVGATTSGTTTRAAVAGIATFDNISHPIAGNGYSLTATSTNLTAATSSSYNVAPGAPAKLSFLVQPQASTAGVPFANDVQVQILDAANNLVPTATNTISIAFTNGTTTSMRGTFSVPAVNGIATFPGLRIIRTGTIQLAANSTGLTFANSATFEVTPAPAIGLTFTRQPFGVTAGAQQASPVSVAITDSLGNTVPTSSASITLAMSQSPNGASLGGTATQPTSQGVAAFADAVFQKSGQYTLTATATGTELATATSNQFFISAAAASKLGFSFQPTATFVNAPLNPGTTSVQVQVQDAFGNHVSGGASANTSITLAFGTVPAPAAGAVLSGTLTNAAAFGTMSVPNDVKISKAGNGFTLSATASGLTAATSDLFNVAAFSTPQSLGWIQAPEDVNPGATFTKPVSVGIVDQFGNVVTSAAPLQISIFCTTNCSMANNVVTTASGLATFPAFTISTAGSISVFSASSLYGGTVSGPFNILATTVATSSTANTGVYDIAINGSTAYFIERAAGAGAIKSVPAAGGTPTTLASSLNNPAALLTDGINVFWIEDGTGLVKRVPVGGGVVTTMSTAQTGMQSFLQSDGTSLFFIANNALGTQREIKKLAMNAAAGTAPTSFYTANCALTCVPTFVITGTTIYMWRSQEGGIYSSPTAGNVPTLVVSSVAEPSNIAFANNTLWFTSTGGNLFSAATNVGATTGSSHGQWYHNSGLTLLGLSAGKLYGLDQTNGWIRWINTSDFSSGFITNMIPGVNSRGIAFDAGFLYFADSSNPTKLRRTPK